MFTSEYFNLFITFQNVGPEFSREFATAMYELATGNGRVDFDQLGMLIS
jgi:hypothetical protein